MRIAIVGAGRVGTALGVLLTRAGREVVAVTGRAETRARVGRHLPGVRVTGVGDAVRTADLVLVTVPDDDIGSMVGEVVLAGVAGRWIVHCSGAAGLDLLSPVVAAGGRRLALHPLQTIPTVERAIEEIPGCIAAVTADDEEGYVLGETLAREIGAVPFRLQDRLRPLYHAAAVLASNDLVALSGVAAGLLSEVGVPEPVAAVTVLQRATVENVGALGAGAALTGPAVRGDAGTVERNLGALHEHAPEVVEAYVVLCRLALALAADAGRLSAEGRGGVEEVLARWS